MKFSDKIMWEGSGYQSNFVMAIFLLFPGYSIRSTRTRRRRASKMRAHTVNVIGMTSRTEGRGDILRE